MGGHTSTSFKKGQVTNPKGRPKGVPNKATIAHKEFSQQLFEDEDYRERLKKRILDGTESPALVTLLYHYAYGKPVDTVTLQGVNGTPIQVASVELSRLTLEEKIALLDIIQRSKSSV